MGVSQILHIYITSLINMTFNIMNMKNQNVLRINNMKACKLNGSQRQLPKPIGQLFRSPNHGGPPTKLSLKVVHPKLSPFSSERIHHHQHLSPQMRATPTSNIIWVNFGTHTLLGPWRLAHFLTQTNLFAKFTLCTLS